MLSAQHVEKRRFIRKVTQEGQSNSGTNITGKTGSEKPGELKMDKQVLELIKKALRYLCDFTDADGNYMDEGSPVQDSDSQDLAIKTLEEAVALLENTAKEIA